MAIVLFFGLVTWLVIMYLKVKLSVWVVYRYISGLCHHRNLLKDTLVRAAGVALLWPLGWWNDYMCSVIGKAEGDLWILPYFLLAIPACRIVYREMHASFGFAEKDWNWDNPTLHLFKLSLKNQPDGRGSKKPFDFDGDKKKNISKRGILSTNAGEDDIWYANSKHWYD